MRKARKNTATRQVIHIVGEGLTELFYFSHLKKILGYRYSISPRLFENNSIEKIDKKIKELLDEDVFEYVFLMQMLAGVLMRKIKKWCRSKRNMKIIPM